MDDRVTLFDRLFAVTIAFVLPGLAVMVGAATVNPVVASWFGTASTNPTVVGFLFVLAAAVAIGIVLTSIRWWIFERMRIGEFRLVQPVGPINEVARREHRAEYEDLRFQHYYHYLASGNMAVALPIAVLIWISGSKPVPSWGLVLLVIGGGALVTLILVSAAREAITRYANRRMRLLGPMSPAS